LSFFAESRIAPVEKASGLACHHVALPIAAENAECGCFIKIGEAAIKSRHDRQPGGGIGLIGLQKLGKAREGQEDPLLSSGLLRLEYRST
jgi:hypothetical protein